MKLWPWRRHPAPQRVEPIIIERDTLTSPPLRITPGALDELRRSGKPARVNPFVGLPKPPPGVRPADAPVGSGMAMDDASGAPGGVWGAWATGNLWGEGLAFPGYPYLAELQQRPEYRNIIGTLAEEMTRKWIKIVSTGDDPEAKADKIGKIEDLTKRLGMREVFNRAAEMDGGFGMGMIFLDLGETEDNAELMTPLMMQSAKIGKDSLRAFVNIDPTWVSPDNYNSINPLREDFFKPQTWFIMGKRVHTTRLLIIRSREVPDILKPSYNFGGLSLSQMAKPYVDNWLRTRQSVSDLLHAFTTWVLKTNMMAYLADAGQLAARLSAFVLGRDNRGLMMIDKENEEFDNISAPLGGLDKLQAQAQEQMASVSKEPLMKMLGITPSGLNDSGEIGIRNWYDHVHAEQEKTFGHNITYALQIIQLSLFGTIDDEITFEFVPLWELDAAGRAAVDKMKADTYAVYQADAVVTNDEVRQQIADDPESPFYGLKGKAPELPDPMDQFDADNKDDAEKIGNKGAEGDDGGANSGI